MAALTMEEIREVELGCLRELDRVCRAHGLRYALAYGTLIGAMRHKGFIPWDDDIDVYMPRSDYEELYRLFRVGELGSRYTLTSYRDHSSIYPFFKLVDTRTRAEESFLNERHASGLWVDIFPLDYVDIESPRLKRVAAQAYRLVYWRHVAATDPRFATSARARALKYAIYPLTRRIDQYRLARRADELARSVNLDPAARSPRARYVLLVDDRMERNILAPSDLFPVGEAFFEGERFPVPAKAADVLTAYYGTWEQIPPPDQLPPAHLRRGVWVGGDSEK